MVIGDGQRVAEWPDNVGQRTSVAVVPIPLSADCRGLRPGHPAEVIGHPNWNDAGHGIWRVFAIVHRVFDEGIAGNAAVRRESVIQGSLAATHERGDGDGR